MMVPASNYRCPTPYSKQRVYHGRGVRAVGLPSFLPTSEASQVRSRLPSGCRAPGRCASGPQCAAALQRSKAMVLGEHQESRPPGRCVYTIGVTKTASAYSWGGCCLFAGGYCHVQ